MTYYRALMVILQAVVVVGLSAAYVSIILGLTSAYDASRATLLVLCGTGAALVAAIAYFAATDFELNRAHRRQKLLKR